MKFMLSSLNKLTSKFSVSNKHFLHELISFSHDAIFNQSSVLKNYPYTGSYLIKNIVHKIKHRQKKLTFYFVNQYQLDICSI